MIFLSPRELVHADAPCDEQAQTILHRSGRMLCGRLVEPQMMPGLRTQCNRRRICDESVNVALGLLQPGDPFQGIHPLKATLSITRSTNCTVGKFYSRVWASRPAQLWLSISMLICCGQTTSCRMPQF